MINALIKLAAEQVLDTRPALEQPITHLKYGLLGGLAAGIVVSIGIATLSGALFFWLTDSGLDVASALLVTGLFLLMQSALIWISANYLGEKRANHNQKKTSNHPVTTRSQQDPIDELKAIAAVMVREAAEGFVEGLKTPPHNNDVHSKEDNTRNLSEELNDIEAHSDTFDLATETGDEKHIN